jgi:feruloyl esterase
MTMHSRTIALGALSAVATLLAASAGTSLSLGGALAAARGGAALFASPVRLLAQAQTGCDALVSFAPPLSVVTAARAVDAGSFAPAGGRGGAAPAPAFASLPAFCRVQASLTPSADSDIRVELWLPLAGWNGRFQGVGNRGWGGAISYPALAQALAAGYAAASTDTGHSGGGARFGLGHPEKIADAGSRAVHEMTAWAKAVVAKYYGRAPAFSYWNGCSLGGRQGFAEAQRFPNDYNGIVAGDPANDVTHLYAARIAWAQAVHKTPASVIPPAKFPLIHRAALAACDASDGVTDGVIGDPTACRFDPAVLECRGEASGVGRGVASEEDSADCLTPAQVETARALYRPVVHPRTGVVLSEGLLPGSELGWGAVAGPQPESNAVDLFKYLVHQDPDWDWRTFDLAADVDRADGAVGNIINSTDANIEAFLHRGGKLLVYHGWADPQTSPLNSVDYVHRVTSRVGAARASSSVQLFMVPGMGHCEGGDGTDVFDKVPPLAQWVEHGTVPRRIVAAHETGGRVDRRRPLCPIGQVARWSGAGSSDDDAAFACVAR